jgi:hypothetical protein
MSAPQPYIVPRRKVRKARKAPKTDTGLRPGGTIYGPTYWPAYANGDYILVPKALLDPRLGLSEGNILYFGILKKYGGMDACYPGQQLLGQEIGLSSRTIKRYQTALLDEGLISVLHCYRRSGVGGQTSNQYRPLWHETWEELWHATQGKPSGRAIGDSFGWSLMWPSILVPLEVARDVSPGAALYYAVLVFQQEHSNSNHPTIRYTNSKLATFGQIDKRLEGDDSRRDRHDSGNRKAFRHYPGRSVSRFNRELKRKGWIRVVPQFEDASGRRTENAVSLLQSRSDRRRSPRKCPKR